MGGFLDADDFRYPVVFFINGIGDHLLSLPAVRALADLFDGRLRVVCAPGMYELFFADLRIAKMFPCVINPTDRTFNAAELANAIGPCDLFVGLMPWHSASITEFIELLAPRDSIGFFLSSCTHALATTASTRWISRLMCRSTSTRPCVWRHIYLHQYSLQKHGIRRVASAPGSLPP